MEIKIQNGAVCLNGLGLPETLSGLEALLQRAHNRLNAVRGAFPPDAVTVFVETPLGEGSVTVHRKKEGDEDDV